MNNNQNNEGANNDEDEIDLDDVEDDENDGDQNQVSKNNIGGGGGVDVTVEEANTPQSDDRVALKHFPKASEKDNSSPAAAAAPAAVDAEKAPPKLSKAEALKLRMRLLKQKMNQARQLNQQAVLEEGERTTHSSFYGNNNTARSSKAAIKQQEQEAFLKRHGKAVALAAATTSVEAGDTKSKNNAIVGAAKKLVEPAHKALQAAHYKSEKAALNEFSPNDFHNSEGQDRNYQRNLKSLPQSNRGAAAAAGGNSSAAVTYNPLDHPQQGDHHHERYRKEKERQGAQRIAQEMHKRIEKRQEQQLKRRIQQEETAEEGDVSHINKRNRHFNEKIARNYDTHTAEIRQNLERGTAL